MTRCRQCNSLLTPSEAVCQECGATAIVVESRWPHLLLKAVTILFFLSLGVTIASLFMEVGASPLKGMLVTAALLFLKRSAADYAAKAVTRA